jgi:hypothetical protein
MSSIRPDQSKSRRFAQERGPANGLGGPGALESSRKGNYTNGEPIALIIGWRAAINPPATKNPAYSESGRACPFGVLEGLPQAIPRLLRAARAAGAYKRCQSYGGASTQCRGKRRGYIEQGDRSCASSARST